MYYIYNEIHTCPVGERLTMGQFKKMVFIIMCLAFVHAYAGNTTTTQKQDTAKAKVTVESKSAATKPSTTNTREIHPTRTNWSKIKDLFM